ncbi:MAG: Croceibacter phage, partial [Bacteroidota bacterium]
DTMSDILKLSGFTILNFVSHNFSPQGFTGIWLLAESHLAIHTFPESGASYIELSSCNEAKMLLFQDALLKLPLEILSQEAGQSIVGISTPLC